MRNVNEWGSYCASVCLCVCVISATLAGAENGCVNVARMRNQKQLKESACHKWLGKTENFLKLQ